MDRKKFMSESKEEILKVRRQKEVEPGKKEKKTYIISTRLDLSVESMLVFIPERRVAHE